MHFRIGSNLYDGKRPLIMGILNITPDSFYPGSRFADPGQAVTVAQDMVAAGVDIIDIGGESTRPGAQQVSVDEEIARVLPIIEALGPEFPVPVSIDTYRAEVALKALDAGAAIVNDISALRFDSGMADVVESTGSTVVLMHMKGTPRTMQKDPHYDDAVAEVLDFLMERVDFAVAKGIDRESIIVDPGIGFGKKLQHNLELLRNIDRFHETGCAVLVGASRKSMIGKITGSDVEDRDWGTAAITAHCVSDGVEIHRVHDVGPMRQVCDVATAIRG